MTQSILQSLGAGLGPKRSSAKVQHQTSSIVISQANERLELDLTYLSPYTY